MADIKNNTAAKEENKPDVVEKEDIAEEVPEEENTSSISEKNVEAVPGMGDGSVPGDEPGTFVDAGSLEAKQ
jgi:hypothetical protein